MFSRTRKIIVLSIMGVLVLLLGTILAVVYGSSYYSVRKQNTEMLQRYVDIYSLEAPPGEEILQLPPADITEELPSGDAPETPIPDEAPGAPPPDANVLPETPDDLQGASDLFKLSSFYSVALSPAGEALAVDTGAISTYNEARVKAVADEILAQDQPSGRLGNYMYIVDGRDDYTLVAFMDTSLTEDSMRKVLKNIMLTGAAAVIILLIAAVFLARVIVRPLEENDRKQKRFISDAGHELKTPVSVIGANAEILSKELGSNEWLSNIIYENERMGSLVSDLLELSRAENKAFDPEPLDLSRLVMREVLPFESVAFERGITLDCSAEPEITVRGSSKQLCQLIAILTDNAISYSTGDTVKVELIRERGNAVLSVINKGNEIPPDQCELLFDRFYRMDEARGEGSGHYGLGLPIAKAITQAHRGKISAECRDGNVIFRVSVPAEK